MAGADGPRFDSYGWGGSREAMLRYGPADGPVVLALPPLFEEANRTRAFLNGLLRRLAAIGIASVLPDLPGTGESLLSTDRLRLSTLRGAAASLAGRLAAAQPVHVLAIRSGALAATTIPCTSRWLLAPQDGPALLRELRRIAAAEARERARDREASVVERDTADQMIAGHVVAGALVTELESDSSVATAGPTRTVRLVDDPRPADRHLPGAPLWRRSEPSDDPALAAQLADDVAGWIATCGG